MAKPALPKGVRDYDPLETSRRNYIKRTIADVYRLHGYQEIETPALERLDVLQNKSGDESDKLLFRILRSGNFLEKASREALTSGDSSALAADIAEKGLRYDLTVPLARFASANMHNLPKPFKRFQIDRVWRGERPQKGRYQEFTQADADVVGSSSLFYDAECISMFSQVIESLKIRGGVILFSNRKLLQALAEKGGFSANFFSFATAIDKLDKIGEEGVIKELNERGFNESAIWLVQRVLRISGEAKTQLSELGELLNSAPSYAKGKQEIEEVLDYLEELQPQTEVRLHLGLARGLDYYTSTIYEVVIEDSGFGSVGSGGRYDELTAAFGANAGAGVGMSFGLERLYLIMEEQNLLQSVEDQPIVLVLLFNLPVSKVAIGRLAWLRKQGIAAELYPDQPKMKKQMSFADKKGVSYVWIEGEDELEKGMVTLKNMKNGHQEQLTEDEAVKLIIHAG